MSNRNRTSQQNRSLHKYAEQVAEEMSAAGYTMKVFQSFPAQIQPTKHSIKDAIRAIAKAQTGKVSTADLTTKEIQAAYDEFNLWLGETCHLHVPWPNASDKDLILNADKYGH